MPAKIPLTRKQQRVLAKIGLMPFTTSEKIAERFGISIHKINTASHRVNLTNNSQRRPEYVRRIMANPATAQLLARTPLWWYPILYEMATTHSCSDIAAVLRQKSNGREVPSQGLLYRIVKRENLRTRENVSAIAVKKRKRVPNNLSREQRALLQQLAVEFFTNRGIRDGKGYTAEDMRQWMIESAIVDSEFVKISPDVQTDLLKRKWFAYLAAAARFYQLHAYRRLRLQLKTRRISETEYEIADTHEETPSQIEFKEPLTKRQREIFTLFSEGMRSMEIARKLGISPQAVSLHKQAIAAKIKK